MNMPTIVFEDEKDIRDADAPETMAAQIRMRDWTQTPLGPRAWWTPWLRVAVDLMLDTPLPALLLWGEEGTLLYNDRWCALMGAAHPEVLGTRFADRFPHAAARMAPVHARVWRGESVALHGQPLPIDGDERSDRRWDLAYTPVRGEEGVVIATLCTAREAPPSTLAVPAGAGAAAAYGQAEAAPRARTAWVEGQTDALRLAVGGAPLATALGVLVRTAIACDERRPRCSIHLADPSGSQLEPVAGWPDDPPLCAEGLRIASDALACGLAAFTGNPVVTMDVEDDASWAPWRWLARQQGYRAIWSFPIPAADDGVAGTITLYFPDPCLPDACDREMVEALRQAAAIIVAHDRIAEQRRRAEASRRDSEARLAQVLDATRMGTFEWRGAGQPVIRSACSLVLLGLGTEAPVPSVDELAIVHHDDRERYRTAFEQAVATGGRYRIVVRIVRPVDGRIAWIEEQGQAYPDPDTGTAHLRGVHWDVSAREEARVARERSEQLLSQVGEASPDLLWSRDAETLRWRYLSPAFETIYGTDRTDALGDQAGSLWLEALLPEDREAALRAVDQARAGEQVVSEYRIRRPDGTIRWIRDALFPIAAEAGVVTLIGGIGSDVTGPHEAERRLQALVDGIPQIVWRAVDGGRWIWASPQWTEFTGQAESASHGFGWLDPVHPDDRSGVAELWSAAGERGEFHASYRLRHAGEGRYRWFQTRATPVRDRSGAIVEWLGTSTDIDDLRRLQERQQFLVAELQHRVRNILTVIRSVFGNTVEAGGALEDVADHFRGRLDSLARTQLVVTQSARGLVDLENLIRDELLSVGASDGPGLTIAGPEVDLPAKVAESIGLAIHELTTNALKYGALKTPAATLDVAWSVARNLAGERRLALRWLEQGVPVLPVRPVRQGFGTELIEEALPYRLEAETCLEFRGGGVRCTIDLPLPEDDAMPVPAWIGE